MDGSLFQPEFAPREKLTSQRLNDQFAKAIYRGGDQMGGPLYGARDPIDPLEFATKNYVDSGALGSGYLPVAGGVVLGDLQINGNFTVVGQSQIPDYLRIAGGTMTGPLNYTATGSTTSRSAQDRAGQFLNVKDFGALIDGTTADGAAFNAALNAATDDTTIYVPHGSGAVNYTWANIPGPGPSGQVHWLIDGVTSGGSPIVQINRPNKGDLVETFHLGAKYLCVESAIPDQQAVLRVDYGFDQAAGTASAICTPIVVNASDNAGAVTSMWGIHCAMKTYSNGTTWPQNVGVSSSHLRYGTAWCAGIHVTMADMSNQPSLNSSGLIGMEIGHKADGADNGFNGGVWGTTGLRQGIGVRQGPQVGTGNAEFSCGVIAGVSDAPGNVTYSTYISSLNNRTYQVFDARGAIAPTGYTDPVAALRMVAGQIIDFNGGTTLKSNAGSYLQYTTTGGNRLRYMIGATERMSIPDTKLTVTGSRGGNAALASLLTALASYGLVTDSTTA